MFLAQNNGKILNSAPEIRRLSNPPIGLKIISSLQIQYRQRFQDNNANIQHPLL
jgi:hypothetical protein